MYITVAIDVPLNTLFTYKIPKSFCEKIKSFDRVLVPFQNKTLVGFCCEFLNEEDVAGQGVKKDRIKEILDADDGLSLPKSYFDWLNFASEYYLCPFGQVLAQAIPKHYFDVKDFHLKKTRKARQIPIKMYRKTHDVELTQEQNEIVKKFRENMQCFHPGLIHGVTGSGKTEVYIDLIKEALSLGRSAIYLVPEIGLTPQTLARLNFHFQNQLLIYHSGLTENQKFLAWKKALESSEPLVIVGTRSALFTPFPNLGLIVIDEEHDSSYKQDDRFRYHARDLAMVRAKALNIPVVLGSATPSLESYAQAKKGNYHYFELTQRVGNLSLPQIEIIDLAKEREQLGWPLNLSQKIVSAIEHYLKEKKQIILFVGQRGYAQNAYCLNCHEIQICPNCSVGFKFHSRQNQLKCHYCDLVKNFDEVCGFCRKKALTLLGFGIQTIEEEVRTHFPKARIERVDSDTYPSPQKLDVVFEKFQKEEIDIIVGTQMMAKGHDFGNVGFVGIAAIDAHLGLPDFRANERTFQTLVQVAGRSGRSGRRGHVMVQSYLPEHQSLKFGVRHDFHSFAEEELKTREVLKYPPYYRLIQIRVISTKENALKKFIHTWCVTLNRLQPVLEEKEIGLLGPSEMPIYKLRGKYRYHLIAKVPRKFKNKNVVSFLLSEWENKRLPSIQFQIDVDPLSLL